MWKPKTSLISEKDSSLTLCMVLGHNFGSARQWFSGKCPVCKLLGVASIPGSIFFRIFCHLSCPENWFSMHIQSLPEEDECTQTSHLHPTVAGWMCSSDLQPKQSCSSQSDGEIVECKKFKKAGVTELTQLMQGHETHFCGYWREDYWCTPVKSVFIGKTLCTGIIPTAYKREYRTWCAHSACTPPPLYLSYALVQATVGVGTVLIWYLILIQYQI